MGGLEQLTSSDLVYPDSLPLPAELDTHDLRHALPGQPLPTSQQLTDPSASSDRLPNGHTEQDIESFINIFLKVTASHRFQSGQCEFHTEIASGLR